MPQTEIIVSRGMQVEHRVWTRGALVVVWDYRRPTAICKWWVRRGGLRAMLAHIGLHIIAEIEKETRND